MCEIKIFSKVFHSGTAGSWEITFLCLNCIKMVDTSALMYFPYTAEHVVWLDVTIENLIALTFSLNPLEIVTCHLGTKIFYILECSQFMKLLSFSLVKEAYNSVEESKRWDDSVKENFLDEFNLEYRTGKY